MKAPLHIATEADAAPESVAQRIRRLQAEAKGLARDHVTAVTASLHRSLADLAEIASGGSAYPDGIRQEAEQLAREIERRLTTINAIAGKAS